MTDAINTERTRLRALKNEVRRKRYKNERDDDLAEDIQSMLDNVDEFLEFGTCDERRGLFVTGPAGTGKSSALKQILSTHPDLQPYHDEFGALVRPCLSIKLPKESKTNVIVAEVIKALGLPNEGSEKLLTPIMHDMLKVHKVRLLHFDEAQHSVRSQTSSAFEAVQDLIKQLVDRDDWPIHVILSGMPRIEKMRDDEQIGRRSNVFPFHRLDFDADKAVFPELLIEIATDCGLTVASKMLEEESLRRLCKATRGAWGTLICAIRSACFRALTKGLKEVTIINFAQEYERNTGALRQENLFTADNWQELKVKETLKHMREEEN